MNTIRIATTLDDAKVFGGWGCRRPPFDAEVEPDPDYVSSGSTEEDMEEATTADEYHGSFSSPDTSESWDSIDYDINKPRKK